MYRQSSIILRYGVITGLIITILGIIAKHVIKTEAIITLGLLTIVLTPLISLLTISIIMMLKKDLYGFILSQITMIIIVISVMLSVHR